VTGPGAVPANQRPADGALPPAPAGQPESSAEATPARAPGACAPESPLARRRRETALAGHTSDTATVRAGLADPEPSVRVVALGAALRAGLLDDSVLAPARRDPAPAVRARAAELAAVIGPSALPALADALADEDGRVVEAACFALGEIGAAAGAQVAALCATATDHPDALCREAAVAALGAIGERDGLATILLAASGDRPAVRRRAVLALAPFDGPEVDGALRRALEDRDWQVRQAAEDLLGVQP
jgi:HEAT repeat protein